MTCNRCMDYRKPYHTRNFTCQKCGQRWVLAEGGPGSYWQKEKEYQQEQQFVTDLMRKYK